MRNNNIWSVKVELNGEQLIIIESNSMSGKPFLNYEEIEVIRKCGEHLLAFAGIDNDEHLLEAAE